ncbi:uncharacterized protein LOC103317008 [Nasonia vitripennis]|uniref:Double jelly roll-like domain-containing protein n=1 Tax=Nasonia vitripennis TaxID=7425 RepID=A0A7M7LRK2_NASVI|nr:uncharacterized protein LOC103317008 [Nasonia vitripennis]
MSTSHQSPASIKSANTTKHSVSKKLRPKSRTPWWKLPVTYDESVAHYEMHAHQPYNASSYNNSDEIHIAIQHQDLCLLPSRSSLRICGRLSNKAEIDKCKIVGLTTLMKGWASINPSQSLIIGNAGWLDVEESAQLTNNDGYFDISIPLSMILGFAEDYRKILINVKHELILTRARNDVNAVIQTSTRAVTATTLAIYEEFKIQLTKIEYWELYEYPLLPATSIHVCTVKTSNQLEKPRFIILGFQTNRKNQKAVNASRFDHCNLSNVKLFLNSQYYPYGNLNLDIDRNQYALLYDMYANFQSAYYGKSIEPMLKKSHYITHIPLVVIDCSKQNESLKNAPVDVRLEFESRDLIPAGQQSSTSAYCLILHDQVVQYNPMNGDVKKIKLV